MQQQGKISPEQIGVVPDVYAKNQALGEVVGKLRTEIEDYKEIAQFVFSIKTRSTIIILFFLNSIIGI